MKKFVAVLAAVMFAMMTIVPMMSACAEEAGTAMYVSSTNGKGVRVRETFSTDAKVVAKLGEGRPVTVLASEYGWSKITFKINGKDYSGYVMSEFLSAKNPLNARQSFKNVKKTFSVKSCAASAGGKVSMWDTTSKHKEHKVRDLTRGEKLTVTGESRAWYQVVDANGVTGYVAKAYVKAC